MYLTIRLIYEHLINALFLTVVLEIFSLLLQREKNKILYILVIIINIFTNLSMNIVLYYIPFKYYYYCLILFEILVIIIEAIILNFVLKDFKKAFRISLINNLISWLGSYLVYYII